MALFDTDALVLRTYDLKDADKIVVLLTKYNGLVRGVAQGAKRIKSKFGGGLEPLSVIHCTYFQKEDRDLASINNVELLKSHFSLASNYEFQMLHSVFVRLVDDFVPPNQRDERIYRMAIAVIDAFESDNESKLALEVYLKHWVLHFAGYLPEWKDCVGCRGKSGITEFELQDDFSIACITCSRSIRKVGFTKNALEVISKCRKCAPREFVAVTKELKEGLTQINEIFERLIARVLDRELTALATR
ncbi:MAG: DNA repair protein RecO [Pyrinomonadaceae bacterium]